MKDSITHFILNNSLAAISAATTEESIFATDGRECIVHRFDTNGNFLEATDTIRPYRRLRRYDNCDLFTATDCSCYVSGIYFLTENLCEKGFVSLDSIFGSNSQCGTERELTDASLTAIGNENFIVGVFTKGAYLFEMSGRRLTRLCKTESDEILTDFIYPGNDVFAMSTLKDNVRTVTVSDNGKTYSGIVERGLTLRMLFENCGDIYGLFGQNYIYNRIIRIYSNGIFELPSLNTNNFFCSE